MTVWNLDGGTPARPPGGDVRIAVEAAHGCAIGDAMVVGTAATLPGRPIGAVAGLAPAALHDRGRWRRSSQARRAVA